MAVNGQPPFGFNADAGLHGPGEVRDHHGAEDIAIALGRGQALVEVRHKVVDVRLDLWPGLVGLEQTDRLDHVLHGFQMEQLVIVDAGQFVGGKKHGFGHGIFEAQLRGRAAHERLEFLEAALLAERGPGFVAGAAFTDERGFEPREQGEVLPGFLQPRELGLGPSRGLEGFPGGCQPESRRRRRGSSD